MPSTEGSLASKLKAHVLSVEAGRGECDADVGVLVPAVMCLTLMSVALSVVLLYHAGRDAPSFTDRQAVVPSPGPDITGALPTGRGTPRTAGLRTPGTASMLNVGCELLAE